MAFWSVVFVSCSDQFLSLQDKDNVQNLGISGKKQNTSKEHILANQDNSGLHRTVITDRAEIEKLLARFESDKANAKITAANPSNWYGDLTIQSSSPLQYPSPIYFSGTCGTHAAANMNNLKWKVYCVSGYGYNNVTSIEGSINVQLVGDVAQTSFYDSIVGAIGNGSAPTRALTHLYLYGVENPNDETYLAWGFLDYQ